MLIRSKTHLIVLAACLLVLLTTCSISRSTPTPIQISGYVATPNAQPTVLPSVTPIPAGASLPNVSTTPPLVAVLAPATTPALTPELQSIANEMDAYISLLTEQGSFSGSILVAYQDQILVRRGYGLANQEENIPAEAQTRMRLASVSKPLTALGIMQLVQAGKLNLHTSICTYLKDCPSAWGSITTHDLLAHTSGLQNYTDFTNFEDVETSPVSPSDLVARFRNLPLEFVPGAAYHYTNSNYVILGQLIESISGQSYPDYMRDHLFIPLGMFNSGYDPGDASILGGTRGYIGIGTKSIAIDTSNLYAAGGLYSTVDDLYLLAQALDEGNLLSPELFQQMYTPNFFNYGYGWKIEQRYGKTVIYHPGLMSGAVTYLGRYPDADLTVIVLSNNEGTNSIATADYLAGMVLGQ